MIKPRTPAPPLRVETLDEPGWTLDRQSPQRFTLVLFHRGFHSEPCRTQVQALGRLRPRFAGMGVEPIVISSDERARAEQGRRDLDLAGLRIGHDADEVTLRSWELFISRGDGDAEPASCCEPGLFLVEPDQTLYFAVISSMSLARPDLDVFADELEACIRDRRLPHGGA